MRLKRVEVFAFMSSVFLVVMLMYSLRLNKMADDLQTAQISSIGHRHFFAHDIKVKSSDNDNTHSIGKGCNLYLYDPFSPEIMALDKSFPELKCHGTDWVRCEMSRCFVVNEILNTTKDIKCVYKDILYVDDLTFKLGKPVVVNANQSYKLWNSDHVHVQCTGQYGKTKTSWLGRLSGFRENVEIVPVKNKEESVNVLILILGSTSLNGLMRNMKKTYKTMAELNFTIFKAFNTLGDQPLDAIFPLLTGKQMNEFSYSLFSTMKISNEPFLFDLFSKHGYRTAYFDDSINTFGRFRGFESRPAHHYLKHYLLEAHQSKPVQDKCIGEMTLHDIIFDMTYQFFKLSGKKLCVSYVSSVACSDECGVTSSADDAAARLLRRLALHRDIDQALLVLVGDHGSSNRKLLNHPQGLAEQRLPLLAVKLPSKLKHLSPEMNKNINTLTTHFDIHTTVLEAVGLLKYANRYNVTMSKLRRGMSLLHKIPTTRSCADADISSIWCSCPVWDDVSIHDPWYLHALRVFIEYINDCTKYYREICDKLTLRAVLKLQREKIRFHKLGDLINIKKHNVRYYFKLELYPSGGIYETVSTLSNNQFTFSYKDIIVTNIAEPQNCFNSSHFARRFCYCRKTKYSPFSDWEY